MNEVIREFLLETHESLGQLDVDLVTLEKEPTERETLARVFRTLHTIKGTAGFLGLLKLQAVAHAGENLLSRLRAGELTFNADIAGAMLGVVDAVRQMLADLEASETEGAGDHAALIQTLERLRDPVQTIHAGPVSLPAKAAQDPTLPAATPMPATAAGDAAPDTVYPEPARPAQVPTIPAGPTGPATAANATPDTVYPDPVARPGPDTIYPEPVGWPAAVPQDLTATAPSRQAPETVYLQPIDGLAQAPHVHTNPATRPTPAVAAAPLAPPTIYPDQTGQPAEARSAVVSDSAIRVDVGLLDKLMTLVGELVLARNQIMQFSASQEDAPFLGTVQRFNLLTTELQANVMKTRMQPIGNIWSKFPRVVRDLAVACGKQVQLDMQGQDTELDRTIVESIRDPLTHLVRNAVDHGIEPPMERLARGKPAEGRLLLHAAHEGGKVVIEIADDGGGIDPNRVRDKAIQARLVTAEQADRMSERDLVNLVFLPGFSTAERVTQFSGRGVGMDVVRTNVEKIGGTIDLENRPGRGTTVKMKIPLTLAIIPALTVTSGGDHYAIPQVSLLELVRLEGEQAQRGIELMHNTPVYRLRGNLLPLVYLNRELQVDVPSSATGTAEINIVVLQADDRQFGLVVDAIHDTGEIVVKPLQKQIKGIGAFAGATIMGDGKVALILDVLGLAQRADVVSTVRERGLNDRPPSAVTAPADRQTVLLFATQDGGRMAIPLSLVARLEEFPRSTLERVGPIDVVQYRHEILPLIHVSRVLPTRRRRAPKSRSVARPQPKRAAPVESDTVQVVVYAGKEQRVGLVVASILDIVEETLVTRCRARRPGVLFTAVVQGRVTEFLDVEALIRSAGAEFFVEGGSQESTHARRRVFEPAG